MQTTAVTNSRVVVLVPDKWPYAGSSCSRCVPTIATPTDVRECDYVTVRVYDRLSKDCVRMHQSRQCRQTVTRIDSSYCSRYSRSYTRCDTCALDSTPMDCKRCTMFYCQQASTTKTTTAMACAQELSIDACPIYYVGMNRETTITTYLIIRFVLLCWFGSASRCRFGCASRCRFSGSRR
jgi:hypothetical protein